MASTRPAGLTWGFRDKPDPRRFTLQPNWSWSPSLLVDLAPVICRVPGFNLLRGRREPASSGRSLEVSGMDCGRGSGNDGCRVHLC